MTVLEKSAIGLGSLAFLGLIWTYVKIVLSWVQGIFVVTQKSGDDQFNNALISYLKYASSKRYSAGDRVYGHLWAYLKPIRRVGHLMVASFRNSSTLYFWRRGPKYRKAPILVQVAAEVNGGSGGGVAYSYLRGTVNWVELTRAAMDYDHEILASATEGNKGRYQVYRHTGTRGQLAGLGVALHQDDKKAGQPTNHVSISNLRRGGYELLHWEAEDVGPEQSASALDALSLTPELMELTEEIKFWHGEQEWYEARGVPWRRGYLFEGRPGTGKTSFCRALAEELDLPVHIPDLSTMDNGELNEAWGKMQASAPCIILLEDVDAVFHGRKNVANQVLTFDCLLNSVDGIERSNGVLLVVTTNHLELVDPALGGPDADRKVDKEASDMPERPGRVDRVVHFAELDDVGRLKMARRILKDCLDQVPVQAALGRADTAAQFQERCFRVALHYKFNGLKAVRSNGKNGHHVTVPNDA